jgi:hypothetical protein
MSSPNPAFSFEKFSRIPMSISGRDDEDPNDTSAFEYFDVLIVTSSAAPDHKSIFISIPEGVRQFDPAADTMSELYFDRYGFGAGCLAIRRVPAFGVDPEDDYEHSWQDVLTLPGAAKELGIGPYVLAEQLDALGGEEWPMGHMLHPFNN